MDVASLFGAMDVVSAYQLLSYLILPYPERLQRVSRQAFANDLFLWIAGAAHDGVAHPNLVRALDMVGRWFLLWRTQFCVSKCECMLFSEKDVRIAQQF